MDLVNQLSKGDKAATARAISLAENNDPKAKEIMRRINKFPRKAHVIGVTGPSGVGKSCLVDRLIETYRRQRKQVGVIAVDPTSPFTGGAILGDRIRMQRHSLDEGVFIRSMGSRGSMGGLSKATKDAIDILAASGKEVIIVETVGIGQVEVDVVRYADTVVIVLVPELGDGVQALKAGLLEIGDIFAINKADHVGADNTVQTILESLTLSEPKRWKPLAVKTIATTGVGVGKLVEAIQKHWKYLNSSSQGKKKGLDRAREQILEILSEEFSEYVSRRIVSKPSFERFVRDVGSRKIDPHSAAKKVFEGIVAK